MRYYPSSLLLLAGLTALAADTGSAHAQLGRRIRGGNPDRPIIGAAANIIGQAVTINGQPITNILPANPGGQLEHLAPAARAIAPPAVSVPPQQMQPNTQVAAPVVPVRNLGSPVNSGFQQPVGQTSFTQAPVQPVNRPGTMVNQGNPATPLPGNPTGVTAAHAVTQPVKPKGLPLPNLYILAIGVSEYSTGVANLSYAATDAKSIADAFQKHSNQVYGTVDVKLLTNKEVTRKSILEGLDWLRREVTQLDAGVLFFAGHGFVGGPKKRHYLLPADVNLKDLDTTAVAGSEVREKLKGMSGKLLMLVDACHSGAIGEEQSRSATNSVKQATEGTNDEWIRDLMRLENSLTVITACQGDELAWEDNRVKAGYFTRAVVSALSGQGDLDGNGLVYLNELNIYVTQTVKKLSAGKQHVRTYIPASNLPALPLSKN